MDYPDNEIWDGLEVNDTIDVENNESEVYTKRPSSTGADLTWSA
jgi:hypothetical protein